MNARLASQRFKNSSPLTCVYVWYQRHSSGVFFTSLFLTVPSLSWPTVVIQKTIEKWASRVVTFHVKSERKVFYAPCAYVSPRTAHHGMGRSSDR